MTKYTFTFDRDDERKFREVLSRLDEHEFNVIEEMKQVDEADRLSDKTMIIEMEEEAALTFRLGMRFIKIRRERTAEELAEEEETLSKHVVKIKVHTGPMGGV